MPVTLKTGSNVLFLLFRRYGPVSKVGSADRKTVRVFEIPRRVSPNYVPLHRASLIPWWPIVVRLLSRNFRATIRVWRATGSRDTHQKRLHQRLLVAWLWATLLSIWPVDSPTPSAFNPFSHFSYPTPRNFRPRRRTKTSRSIEQSYWSIMHTCWPLFLFKETTYVSIIMQLNSIQAEFLVASIGRESEQIFSSCVYGAKNIFNGFNIAVGFT